MNGIDNNRSRPVENNTGHYGTGKRVPASCAIEIDSNRGRSVTMYSENCLRREGFNYRLPTAPVRCVSMASAIGFIPSSASRMPVSASAAAAEGWSSPCPKGLICAEG